MAVPEAPKLVPQVSHVLTAQGTSAVAVAEDNDIRIVAQEQWGIIEFMQKRHFDILLYCTVMHSSRLAVTLCLLVSSERLFSTIEKLHKALQRRNRDR